MTSNQTPGVPASSAAASSGAPGSAGDSGVRILDDGPGIAEADRPLVFDRFYRGSGEAELFNAGLGIGLSIARDIVERHGGRIALDNREGGGAVLEIVLPVLEPALT